MASIRRVACYWLNNGFFQPDKVRVPSKRALLYKDKRAMSKGRLPDTFWGHGDDTGVLNVIKESRVCGTYKESRHSWHDNQLPEALVKRILLGHCPDGGRVLDPFIGSGTTAYVCQDLKLDCVGIDVSEAYLGKINEELERRKDILKLLMKVQSPLH